MTSPTPPSPALPPVIPVIRLNDPDESSSETLRAACRDVGFFYLEGHGVSPETFRDVLYQSRALFALPPDEKARLSDRTMSRGYTAMEEETLDPARQPNRGDTKEGFYVGRDVPRSSEEYNPSKLSGPNVWPIENLCSLDDCDSFRRVMTSYHDEMCSVGMRLVRLLALAIGVDRHRFDADFDKPLANLRLLRYAAVTSRPDEGVFGCGAHSDYGMVTLLLTDGAPGLQIFTRDGRWIDVPHREGAFVVNLGDMLERWTNGVFRSTMHRVLTSGERERYSVPFFFDPSFDTVVDCLAVCCSEDNPPRYAPTTSGLHLMEKYKETHADFTPQG